jgi:class 3 adenylate cyclase/tetratricopeptide (TPR) repeat protein
MSDDLDRRSLQPDSAQRRHLTILYVDLSDSTRLSAILEAEHYAELLDEVRRTFERVVAKHGGTVNQYQGDGLQAFFGHPNASEQDGRRAIEAALDVHDLVHDSRGSGAVGEHPGLRLHSGIHAGLTLIRAGDEVAGRFELFGPAPGIAKHLSDAAEEDEILVSDETLGPDTRFFHTGEQRRLNVKGRDAPLAVHRVLGRTPGQARFDPRALRGLVPFIGRRRELGLLQRALEDAIAGKPCFFAVAAPGGMGKTRLAEEFLQRCADGACSTYRGYCESYLSAEPLQPFLQILRSMFHLTHGTTAAAAAESIERGLAAIDARLAVHRAELLQALSFTVDGADGSAPRRDADNTVAALRDLFDRLAADRPQVLFIDDWQWADDATRQVVRAIRELKQRPILILVSTRGLDACDADMTDAQVLELDPFTDAEAEQTIRRLLPTADPFVADEIRRHGGGSPLFIEELCHSAASALPSARPERAQGGSAWLETLIQSRVERLPEDQAQLVRAAAVIGVVLPAWLLERITGCDAQHPLVRGLAEHDLLFPVEDGATLRFKHGITRDVVYNAIGLQQRRAMHLRIARLLREQTAADAAQEACEALAYHYAGAAELGDAARYAELAGDKAKAASSLDRAKAQYLAALEMLDRQPATPQAYRTWSSIVQRLGLASVFDPSRDQIEVFARAVARARVHGDTAGVAHAEYWLAYIHYALGDARAAVEHCRRALQAAGGLGDDLLVVQVRATLGQALAAAGEYRGALELLDEAIATKRRHRTGARPAVGSAYALTSKGSVLGDLGQFQVAQACFDEALESVRGAGHEVEGSILCWRSGVLLWQGHWEDAHQAAVAAQRIGERVKSLYLFAMGRGLAGYAHWNLHRDADSLQAMADATTWLEARDKGLFISLNHGWLADAMAASGRPVEARHHAACALRRVRKLDRLGAAMACRAIARAAAASGDWPAAARHVQIAANVAQARTSPHEAAANDLCRAEIAHAQGRRGEAAAALARACAAFEAMQMHWHLAQAARLHEAL